jgi:endonuclease/exonuclease/phosphatase (EEP) superfamily protein YafD
MSAADNFRPPPSPVDPQVGTTLITGIWKTRMETSVGEFTPQPLPPAVRWPAWPSWVARLIWLTSFLSLLFYGFGFLAKSLYPAELATHFHYQNFWLMFWTTILLAGTPYRRWRWLAIVVTTLAAATALRPYWPITSSSGTGAELRLMSFNVLGSNSDVDAVVAEIRRQQPDVLVLQEYTARWHQDLSTQLTDFPHRALHPRWHGFGVAIYSKLPLTRTQVVPITRQLTDVPALVADVETGDTSLTVIGIHTASPVSPNRLRLRNQQLQEIGELANRITGPKLVVGDFNCTPWSPYFSDFHQQTSLRDSRLGFGHQGSWSEFPELPIRIPIDHAMVSPEVVVRNRWTGRHAGSDHRPIVLDLRILSPTIATAPNVK